MVVLVPWLVVTKDIAEIFSNNIMSLICEKTLSILKYLKIIQPFLSDSKNYTLVFSLTGTGEDSGDFLKVFYCQILSGDNFEPIKSESVCRLYLKTKEIVRFLS